MKLHHINIKAPWDLLEKEKAFFCQILKLAEGERPNFPARGFWLYAENIPIVHLSESNSHGKTSKQGYFDHVAFQSTDHKALIKELEANDIHYSAVYLADINMTQVFFRSPTDTRVEVNFENEAITSAA